MRIQALSIGNPKAARLEKLPIYEDWEEYLDEFSKTAPEGLTEVF